MLHRLDRRGHVGETGQHDHRQLRIVGEQRVERYDPAGIREAQIQQHHVGRVFRRQLPPLRCRCGPTGGVSEGLEELDEGRADRFVVVDDQDGAHYVAAVAGNVSVSVVPCSGWLSIEMVPWCSSMMRWQSAKPMPVPPALVL